MCIRDSFYIVAQAASTNDQFEIERSSNGVIYRFCAVPTTTGAVSYTHLDVYKRQGRVRVGTRVHWSVQ